MSRKTHGGFRHPTVLFWVAVVFGSIGSFLFLVGFRFTGGSFILGAVWLAVWDLRVREVL